MIFAIHCMDKADCADVRASAQSDHAHYMRKHASRIVFGGPLLDKDGVTRIGVLMVVDCGDTSELEQFLQNEPYHLAGLFAQVTISGFSLVMHSLASFHPSTHGSKYAG
ncbi:hypothetical protein SAMN05216344_11064 [Polaromonas sp. OV174]|nr:hypothetical protein SAMN05216344_11064 [Polaromonas sp. OV174]